MGYANTLPTRMLEYGGDVYPVPLSITTGATDLVLPGFQFGGIPPLGGIDSAYLDVVVRRITNTSVAGSNYLDGTQYITFVQPPATEHNAIRLEDLGFEVPTNTYREGFRIYGNIDIKDYIETTGNQVWWHGSKSFRNNLVIDFAQSILRVVYE